MLAGHELRQGEGLLVLRQTGRVDKTGVVAFAQYLAAEQAFGKTSRRDRQIEAALHQGPADDLAMSLSKNQSQPRRTSRSEERRVGKECVRAWTSRWSPY